MLKDVIKIIMFILEERNNKVHEKKLMQILKSKFEQYTNEQLTYAVKQMQKSKLIKIENDFVIYEKGFIKY